MWAVVPAATAVASHPSTVVYKATKLLIVQKVPVSDTTMLNSITTAQKQKIN
jgi:hypothetical protein